MARMRGYDQRSVDQSAHLPSSSTCTVRSGPLTCEFLAIDRLSTSSVAPGEVTTLEHELGDDTVERGTLISEAVLASGKLTEVLCSLGDDVVVQLEHDAAARRAADGDIELRRI